LGEEILEQYLQADIVVIGAAMYNFGLPSTLKAWIDRICVAGRTFKYTEQGSVGLAGNKKVYIASRRGGFYCEKSPTDIQEDFLNTVCKFTGVNDIEVIRVEGVNMGETVKAQALQTALQQVQAI